MLEMNDPRLTYIPTELTRLKAIASDYEWEGDKGAADLVWARVKDLQKKLDDRILYDPKF